MHLQSQGLRAPHRSRTRPRAWFTGPGWGDLPGAPPELSPLCSLPSRPCERRRPPETARAGKSEGTPGRYIRWRRLAHRVPLYAQGAAGRLASDSVTYFRQTRRAQSPVRAQTSWRAPPSDSCDVLLSPLTAPCPADPATQPHAGSRGSALPAPESSRTALISHAHSRQDAFGTGGRRVGLVCDAEGHGVTRTPRSRHPAPEGQGIEGSGQDHGETARRIRNVDELRPCGLVSSTSAECGGIERSTRVCTCTRVCACVCAGPVPSTSGPLCPM